MIIVRKLTSFAVLRKLIKLRKSCCRAQRLFYSLKLIKLKQVIEFTLFSQSSVHIVHTFFTHTL